MGILVVWSLQVVSRVDVQQVYNFLRATDLLLRLSFCSYVHTYLHCIFLLIAQIRFSPKEKSGMSNSTSATNSPSGKSEIITTPPQSRTGMAALKTWVDDMVDRTKVSTPLHPGTKPPGSSWILADSTGKSRPKRSRSTFGKGEAEPNREMEGRGQGKAASHLTCHQDRDWPFDDTASQGH